MQLKSYIIKEQVIKSIRGFFYTRGFHEVVIPVFHISLPLEPNIYAFQMGQFYLSTSPEAYLKKMLAKGIGNCFAISHTFRDLEDSSPIHTPEFLMLEWYRENADYREIMEECRELILFLNQPHKRWSCKANLAGQWRKLSMVDLFKKYAKLDLDELCHAEFISASNKIQKRVRDDYNIKEANWEQIFNQIFLNEIEPHLPIKPFYLTDYPARISPLCAKRRDKPYLAQRFELYISGVEIGNGNTENTDWEEVLNNFKNEQKRRKKLKLISPPIDMEFIKALKKMHGKSYAGMGLGIDRLVMVLAGMKNIRCY